MTKHSFTNLFKKVFTVFFAASMILMFTGCPGPNTGSGGDEVVTDCATISITEFPDGVNSIAFISSNSSQYPYVSYIEINKSDLPYNRTFKSNETYSGDKKIDEGLQCKIFVHYSPDFGTLQGENPFKVLLNGTALEETKQEYNTRSTPIIKTNLVQYNYGYEALLTLAKNNTITFSKGDLRKIKPTDIKPAENSYTFIDVSGLDCSYGFSYEQSDNSYPFQCVTDGLYCCLPNKKIELIVNSKEGNMIKPDSFKIDNTQMDPLVHYDGYSGFKGKFTTGSVGKTVAITVEQEPIEDLLQVAGKTIAAEFLINSSDTRLPASGYPTIIFSETFVPGKKNTATIKTSPSKTEEGEYYYQTDDNKDFDLYVDVDNTNSHYTVVKNGDEWIITSSNSVTYYTGKIIRINYSDNNYVGLEENMTVCPTFIDFELEDIKDTTKMKVYIDDGKTYKLYLKKEKGSENCYYFPIIKEWGLDPLEPHSYYIEVELNDGTKVRSNSVEFKIKTIKMTLPEQYQGNVKIGTCLELPVQLVNQDTYPTQYPTIRLYGDAAYRDSEGNFPSVDAEFKDGKIIIPTYKDFKPVERTTMFITYSSSTSEMLSNEVTIHFVTADSAITISPMSNAVENISKPIFGEKNLIPISFSNDFVPANAKALCKFTAKDGSNTTEEYYYPIVNGNIEFTGFATNNKDEESIESWDMSVTTCGLQESNTITITPRIKDTYSITITDTSNISVTIGDVIRIPISVGKYLDWNEKLYTYMYAAGESEASGGSAACEIENIQSTLDEQNSQYTSTGTLVIPTYSMSADNLPATITVSVASRPFGKEKFIPTESEEKVNISIAKRAAGDTIDFKLIDYNLDPNAVTEVTRDVVGGYQPIKITPHFASPLPEEAKYILYVKENNNAAAEVHEFTQDLISDDEDLRFNVYGNLADIGNDPYFRRTATEGFKFASGKSYSLWVESCGVTSNTVTLTISAQ